MTTSLCSDISIFAPLRPALRFGHLPLAGEELYRVISPPSVPPPQGEGGPPQAVEGDK